MARPSNREKILIEGLRVVHERGFAGASVRDIAQAAQVPLGSFTNHFPSKEAFGLEILERYYEMNREVMTDILADSTRTVHERINAYFDHVIQRLCSHDMRGGCMVGNFCAEVADQSEVLRLRLGKIFRDMRDALTVLLREGVQSGELQADLDCEATAGFIYSALQGAILIAKVLRMSAPLENCRQHILSNVLN
ncbi:TetR/AcrR family transcriptional regulator [Acidocella aminolytica]|jgi:TetR/AcrR family transcriptional repressor of nem operon|uniref:Transcriptional regulator TetR n=1 Tax=Acidocella aminolytica 101 = DSM 11237 TaxID=1120923 RepID=A0A0D6PI04_9PROT|nr:TetR/AcrR family transcriptional regulator [Acidocella aminolytica]GAN80459.1 transcriptional regulator TetR [Acidocella aminolytica 101 = DSM 11237]GBQ35840.1 transcriptional regulator [Acidocella aminolytica 101 = DSM 11237]SHE96043.1 transcriptional regulator, TetR family [Acidocella aminolytica 101 = DSM 11237]